MAEPPEQKDQDEIAEESESKEHEAELGGRMTFIEHLEELRKRLMISIVTLVVGMFILYGTSAETLRYYFLKPIHDVLVKTGSGNIMFTGMVEGFMFDLKLSALAGLFVASPMLFYQFWAFVAPGLYKRERRYVLPFIILSTACFVGGALFAYLVFLPIGYQFFASFATEGVAFNPKLNEYFSFTVTLLLAFGVIFEMPLIVLFAVRIGLIDYKFLSRNNKYFIVVAFILGGVLTPGPDPVSQLLMAGPLVILFQISMLVAYIFRRRTVEETEEQTGEKPEEKEMAG